MKFTTVKLSVETKERLVALGRKGETYDQLVRRLLDASLKAATQPKQE